MRSLLAIVLAMAGAGSVPGADEPDSTRSLRVLFVGNVSTERGQSYARFLGERFTLVGSADPESFDARSAPAADCRGTRLVAV